MDIKKYLKLVIGESIYTFGTIIFLIFLNHLNNVLKKEMYDANAFQLLSYRNFLPLYFFAGTIFLAIIGVILIARRFNQIKYYELEFDELITNLIAILIVVFLIITLIIFINNPILKAIITVICFIVLLSYPS